MKTEQMGKLVHQIGKPMGYRRRSGLLWRTRGELTTLIHLQRSQWSGGMYVNLGVIPSELITKAVPPSTGYWPLEERAANLETPHQEMFQQLERDTEDTMQPEEMAEAFTWLLAWMDETFGDTGRVRQALLGIGGVTIPLVSSRLTTAQSGEWPMVDWARGELRSPTHYYKGTPYYR